MLSHSAHIGHVHYCTSVTFYNLQLHKVVTQVPHSRLVANCVRIAFWTFQPCVSQKGEYIDGLCNASIVFESRDNFGCSDQRESPPQPVNMYVHTASAYIPTAFLVWSCWGCTNTGSCSGHIACDLALDMIQAMRTYAQSEINQIR